MAWTKTDSESLAGMIRMLDPLSEVKYMQMEYSTLGGEDRASIFIKVSLDERSEWNYGIYHNSRYAIFHLTGDKLSMPAKHHTMPKFRKATIKNQNLMNVAERIVKYVSGV